MNALKGLFQNRSVLIKYIVSYLVFAVLICSIIGIAIFTVSAREINQMAAREIGKRLQGITDDFDGQMDVMQEIAHEIASLPEYKLAYIEKHKYREIEMLESLEKYSRYSPLIKRLFLLYKGQNTGYISPEKVTSRFSSMASDYLGCDAEEEIDALYQRIVKLEKQEVIRLGNQDLLFCYPIRYDNVSGITAYIGFIANNKTVDQRIRLIGGGFEGEVRLIWNGGCIYGVGDDREAQSVSFGRNGISAELISAAGSPYQGLKTYSNIFWGIIIMAFVVACVIAIITANRNYRPILELVNEFAGDVRLGENEFNSLQGLLKHSIEENRITQERLQENMTWLDRQRRQNDEQMAMLALTGNLHFSPYFSEEEDRLFADGRRFVVICISMQEKNNQEKLCLQIAELGERDTQLCAVRLLYEALIAVVVSFRGKQDIHSVVELIRELLDAYEMKATLGVGTVTDTPNHIPDSFAAALSNLNLDMKNAGGSQGEWYDEVAMNQLLTQIREGQNEIACETLGMIFDQIEESNPSVLIRSCAYSDVINTIIRLATRNGVEIMEDNLSIVLLYNQPMKIRERLYALVDDLCACFLRKKDDLSNAQKDELLHYIHLHFKEYGLCLNNLEKLFGMSVRQIEQMLKAETGMTFKEYLTKLRMDEAKRLLREGMNVAETSQAVCYMSVSFFIKTFKRCVGITPAEYRKSPEE